MKSALFGIAAAVLATAALADGHVPDLEGREVVIVTENAYPPLQFVDPNSGDPDRVGI